MNQILAIEQLSVALDGNAILSDINLALNAGEIMGLVGASGCGKTTLLNTLAGFIRFEQGQITLDISIVINQQEFVEPEHRHIGMIFQDYALFPHLTVKENVKFGLKKLANSVQQERVDHLLNLMKLSPFADRYPHQLSGGQQQRVAIARALAPQPKLLLLDEPFSNIDARLRHELMVEIRGLLKQLNISAIFVTHNKDEVFTFADKMAVMNEGKLLQVGAPIELCQHPKSWLVADFLQLGSWLPVNVSNGKMHTGLGLCPGIAEVSNASENGEVQQLLVRSQYLELAHECQANVQVEYIEVTEQGYHYQLSSYCSDDSLSFEQLSFYSEQIFHLGDKIALKIKAHKPLVFDKESILF